MPTQRILFLSFPVGLLLAAVAVAADLPEAPAPCDRQREDGGTLDRCARCGCHAPCQNKVCKVICEMKTITEHCWCVEREEFCAPLPNLGLDGRSCYTACGVQGCGESCQSRCDACPPPKCGKVRSRKRLIKKEITYQVPVYKCVVVPTCGCGNGGCSEGTSARVSDSFGISALIDLALFIGRHQNE